MLGIRPKLTTVEVDVEDVVKAIEKNGFEHLRDMWFDGDGACVLGQGAKNLGVVASTDVWGDHANPEFATDEEFDQYENLWFQYNLLDQLNKFEVSPDSPWYLGGESAGTAIVRWNDARLTDDAGNPILDEEGLTQFKLKTYGEVAQMAREILTPNFGKKVTLLTYDYY